MKKGIVFLMAVFFTVSVSAQTEKKSGVVIYKSVMRLDIKLGGDAAQFQHMIPKERKSTKELIFNEDASLYRLPNKPEEENVSEHSAGEQGMVINISQEPNEIIFSDLKLKMNLEQREFMSRSFLVQTKTDTVQWKLTGNQKEIIGYNCLEAELIGSMKKTIAWFTPLIPVSTGPNGFVGLPGLILSIDIEDGKTTYLAQSVDLKEVDSSLLVKPSEGKKVTSKEFNKIVEDKKKEMGGQGGGHFVIYKN